MRVHVSTVFGRGSEGLRLSLAAALVLALMSSVVNAKCKEDGVKCQQDHQCCGGVCVSNPAARQGFCCTPGAEVCDGADNDCDLLVDEDLGSITCGEGDCATTVPVCANGALQTCDPSASDGGPCDDGNACTINDTCTEGSCAGEARVCDDSSVCTVDTCNPATGCVFDPISCDDGNACTGDICNPVVGCMHSLTVCLDFDVCDGIRSCDPATGNCVTGSIPFCDDFSLCTADSCHPVNGCANTPITCPDDNDACTAESCDALRGCQSTPISCDDENPCTDDSCNPSTGCVHTPASCDDNNLCTNDSCSLSVGCQHAPISCDDGNPCTVESCFPSLGCSSANACVSTTCTVATCNPGVGCAYEPRVCPADSNECTVASCHPLLGCQQVLDHSLCNDGNPCTSDRCAPDTIVGGQVIPGGCINLGGGCDDGNACTSDSCVGSNQCLHVTISCVDGNPCTSDVCDPDVGCPPAAECSFGQECENGGCCWSGIPTIGCDGITPCCGGAACVFTPGLGGTCVDPG